ncbi:hypothetical protein GCM10022224_078260 [Nonomuraea antimicrobica]|uniref:Uncharacterized protein n=1 Tax=Nonomuraea antimicrobica TaxID=561173 RepID=A0ABP7D511_9ACTN
MRRYARDVNYAGGVLDKEQNVEPVQRHRVDMEQIACPDALGLRLEELTPARSSATWRGIEPGSFEDVSHGAGRYPKADSGQFTADALTAPRGILPGQAQPPPGCPRRGNEEDIPRRARKQPRQGREHNPIPRMEIKPLHLTAQYGGNLVAKHHDLRRLGPITATQQDQELKGTPEDEVEGRPQHRQQDARDLIMLEPRTPRSTSTAEFPHPTGRPLAVR